MGRGDGGSGGPCVLGPLPGHNMCGRLGGPGGAGGWRRWGWLVFWRGAALASRRGTWIVAVVVGALGVVPVCCVAGSAGVQTGDLQTLSVAGSQGKRLRLCAGPLWDAGLQGSVFYHFGGLDMAMSLNIVTSHSLRIQFVKS